jgi:hypothetical protein
MVYVASGLSLMVIFAVSTQALGSLPDSRVDVAAAFEGADLSYVVTYE